jgi:hypothetical protein
MVGAYRRELKIFTKKGLMLDLLRLDSETSVALERSIEEEEEARCTIR